jgi:replication factor C large subunit
MDFIVEAKQKLILIDEVDGIYGTKDRGAVPTILDLIEKTQFPIILCSNEYKQSLQTLYRKIKKFEVYPLSKPDVMKITSRVLKSEKISGFSQSSLETIVEKNNGDLRGVINDLQAITQGNSMEDLEILGDLRRDSIEEIFSLIRDLFQEVTSLREARNLTNKSDVDYNFLYKWVGENIPGFMYDNSDFAEAYDNLALADEIFGRIRKNMYWGLLPYFYDLFAGGVALSRKISSSRKGFIRITNPKYFRSASLSSAEKSLFEKINAKYDISQYEVLQDFLPFLKVLSSSSRKQQKIISDWLELDAKEKKLLKTD